MNESKIDLTDRLRREKRWGKAAQFKDSTVKKLRDSGMKRGEANAAAWAAMAEKFSPLATPQEEEPDQDQDLEFSAEQIAALPPGSLEDFLNDVNWAYANLALGSTYTAEPSSTGALALLAWARANKDDFFSKMVPRALQHQEKKPGSSGSKLPDEYEMDLSEARAILAAATRENESAN